MKSSSLAQIECTICKTQNDAYAIVCVSCRSYLQNRIPNLDLFQTIWHVVENPFLAFREVRLAEHKNFALFLFAVTGIAISFAAAALLMLGELFDSLLDVIIRVTIAGFLLGLILAPLVALLNFGAARVMGGKGGWRDSLGITAYALVPVLFLVVLLIPIELLSFGIYQFTQNPHPFTVKPVSYVILSGLKSLLLGWSAVLWLIGNRVGFQLAWWKSALATLLVVGITAVGLMYAAIAALQLL